MVQVHRLLEPRLHLVLRHNGLCVLARIPIKQRRERLAWSINNGEGQHAVIIERT
ncbi:hypothetical protein [Methylorubrum aminovorans]